MKKISLTIACAIICSIFATSSWAGLTFINLNDTSSPATVDIGVDATTNIAGAAFTLQHSADLTVTVTSDFFETFTVQGFDAADGLDAQGKVDGYDSPLVTNTISTPLVGTRIAAARFEEKTATTTAALFSLSITSTTEGPYTIEILATKLYNTDAGYDAAGETIDLLIGAGDPVQYPDPTDPNAYPVRLGKVVGNDNYVFASTLLSLSPTSSGDVDGISGVDVLDVRYLLYHVYDVPGYETLQGDGDVDGIEGIDVLDVRYLLYHVYDVPGYETLH